MIKVSHLRVMLEGMNNPVVYGMHAQIAFRANIDTVKEVVRNAAKWDQVGLVYEVVAEVEGDDLDDAFQLTNHIDRPWNFNSGVTEVGLKKKRSTSVGDLMHTSNGKTYMVDKVGFTEVTA